MSRVERICKISLFFTFGSAFVIAGITLFILSAASPIDALSCQISAWINGFIFSKGG